MKPLAPANLTLQAAWDAKRAVFDEATRRREVAEAHARGLAEHDRALGHNPLADDEPGWRERWAWLLGGWW